MCCAGRSCSLQLSRSTSWDTLRRRVDELPIAQQYSKDYRLLFHLEMLGPGYSNSSAIVEAALEDGDEIDLMEK